MAKKFHFLNIRKTTFKEKYKKIESRAKTCTINHKALKLTTRWSRNITLNSH